MMKVSVITPVYNAAQFVTQSVESALEQPETAEVLLIEDNSTDNSLAVCEALAARYDKVRLLRHPNGENRGAGASRNLGMKNARFDYIAFVDADDFYLPNRFNTAKEILNSHIDCEGVYETIGSFVFNEAGRQRWLNAQRDTEKLIGLTKPIDPDQLGLALIQGIYGGLTLDGLIIKRSVLSKSGFMNESLRLHQDTDFIIRVAIVAKLYSGELSKPVALRGIHDHNRLSAPRSQKQEFKNRMAFWMSLYHWAKVNTDASFQAALRESIISYVKAHKYFRKFPREYFPTRLIWATRLPRLFRYPEMIIDGFKHRKIKA